MVYIENGKVVLSRGVLAQTSKDGSFARKPTNFHNVITPPGTGKITPPVHMATRIYLHSLHLYLLYPVCRMLTSQDGPFPAEAGRYHLYIANACPWANRTSIVRALKGLEGIIGMSVVHPYMEDPGWRFNVDDDETDPEYQEDPKRKNFPGSTGVEWR